MRNEWDNENTNDRRGGFQDRGPRKNPSDPVECKGCGAPCRWLRTNNDKNMLVEANPVPVGGLEQGDTVISEHGETIRLNTAMDIEKIDPDISWYVSHFAKCPQADQFRKKRSYNESGRNYGGRRS